MIESLIMYCSAEVTTKQIEVYKSNICDEWKYLPIEIKKFPMQEKSKFYASKLTMKQRGINLINK